MRKAILACLATALVVGATTATAASLITSKDIKNRSITGRDIAKGTISAANLSKGVRDQLAADGSAQSQSPGAPGTPGADGAPGRDGADGAPGRDGAAGPEGPEGPAGAPGLAGIAGIDGTHGATGATGATGPQGPEGPKGDPGALGATGPAGATGPGGPVTSSGNWGTIDRSSTGSPVTALRAGPTRPGSAPPFGSGSLSLLAGTYPTANTTQTAGESATYGNEVDFFGTRLADLAAVALRVWSAEQNSGMPMIVIEVDPDGAETKWTLFHTLTAPAADDTWSGPIDATGTAQWRIEYPRDSRSTRCEGIPCPFTQVRQEPGRDATILSVAVRATGPWQGAVDGLRINNQVFDFEEHGVVVRAP